MGKMSMNRGDTPLRAQRSLSMLSLVSGAVLTTMIVIAIGATALRAFEASAPITEPAVVSLQEYLAGHPEAAAELRTDPEMIDHPLFIAHHPGLRRYLADHPAAGAEFKSHPYRFMKRVESD